MKNLLIGLLFLVTSLSSSQAFLMPIAMPLNTGSDYVLDRYSQSLVALDFRLISSAYNGKCIRVRRSSDNAEMDIGFVEDVLDTATLLAFVGAGNGYVVTWYDQSGNNRNFSQATAAQQMTIVSSGTLITMGGHPACATNYSDSTSLSSPSGQAVSMTSESVFVVCEITNNEYANSRIFSQKTSVLEDYAGTGHYIPLITSSDTEAISSWASSSNQSSISITFGVRFLASAIHTGSDLTVWVDGVSASSYAHTLNNTWDSFTISGSSSWRGEGITGKIQTVIVWGSDQSTNRESIETDINTW